MTFQTVRGLLSRGVPIAAVLALAACGAETAPQAVVTQTVLATASPSVEPSATVSATPEESPTPTAAPTASLMDEDEASGILDDTARGQALALNDIFKADGQWYEDRYSVSDRSDIRALGTEVSCYGGTPSLELRLARRFDQLSFSVGQDNASANSDQVLIVEVVTNGEQSDLRKVPFDRVQPFEVPVSGANAVIIKFDLDQDCDDSVIAVVESLTVS